MATAARVCHHAIRAHHGIKPFQNLVDICVGVAGGDAVMEPCPGETPFSTAKRTKRPFRSTSARINHHPVVLGLRLRAEEQAEPRPRGLQQALDASMRDDLAQPL